MKSNKNSVTKTTLKPTAPAKMKSAITNLNQLLRGPAKAEKSSSEKSSSNGESERKPRSKPPATKSQRVRQPATTVTAKINVGYGNALFIRGEGPGLSWDKGMPLECRDDSIWVWSADTGKEEIEFKLLLNDEVWTVGDNVTLAAGKTIEVVPRF